jgi:uncharacterized protein (TIGR03086 family)
LQIDPDASEPSQQPIRERDNAGSGMTSVMIVAETRSGYPCTDSTKEIFMFDLGPAAQTMSGLVSGVRDDQLDQPTPCRDWTVAELLAHVHQFATVFTQNGRKEAVRPPEGLVEDWRVAIPGQLDALASAWHDESAWQGRVSAGGVEMDAPDNAVVGIEELTVHGWDLARATGQDVRVDAAALDQVDRFFELFGEGPFGPAVHVSDGATRLEKTVARTGRDPSWQPAI